MSGRITAYSYVHDGAAETGSTQPAHNSTATLAVIEENDPGTTVYVRIVTPTSLYLPGGGDQLATWAGLLATYTDSGDAYTCTYDTTTRRITIASAGAAFRPVMVGDGAVWLGFTQSMVGYDTSWTGESMPAGVAELLTATVEPAEDGSRIDLHEYRHGRAVAVAWGNHQVHKCTLYLDGNSLGAFDPGYLMAGRVRIQQGADTAAYSATNIDGVIDGFVVATDDITEEDDIGGSWSVSMLVAVPRGA
jgi:hypothetical protein